MTNNIQVRYSAVDGYTERRTFKTLAGARRYAQKWVGEQADIGRTYAVSADGVGTVRVDGATLAELLQPVPVHEDPVEPLRPYEHSQRDPFYE